MRAACCTAAILLCVATPSPAADWVAVARDGDIEHYVDRASIERQGGTVRVLKRAVYLEPHPIGDTPGMPLMKETLGVVECDCERLQHRAVSLQLIGTQGQVLYDSGTMKRVWESIDPGSPGRATLDFACTAAPR